MADHDDRVPGSEVMRIIVEAAWRSTRTMTLAEVKALALAAYGDLSDQWMARIDYEEICREYNVEPRSRYD